MNFRKWNLKKDYPTIVEWCNKRDWDLPIPKELLASEGIVVEDEYMICVAVLYTDKESGFASSIGFLYCSNASLMKGSFTFLNLLIFI